MKHKRIRYFSLVLSNYLFTYLFKNSVGHNTISGKKVTSANTMNKHNMNGTDADITCENGLLNSPLATNKLIPIGGVR